MPNDLASTAPAPVRLADYTAPDWLVERVELRFDLAPKATRVHTRIAFRHNPQRPLVPLRLDGRNLALISARIDGQPVPDDALSVNREILEVALSALPGDRFLWECETEIDPEGNTALEGLYMSRGMYCTQCEAEGFRKITYYPDRPDVMAPFTVRIEADRDLCPVLLSNGNPRRRGELGDGRHFAEWEDPHPKPAYLFALVAGTLVSHDDRIVTASGRDVALKVWVRPDDEDKCAYAMDALKRSMRWDEDVYGREYDLDIFQIVAVDDFNMGAMENKGLNIFNSKYVLASPETATDTDYALIEGIVAHEYFHNWTGNRITCRDWFQLCLKEGLTVFRDQQFSADQRSAPVQRIGDVKQLRARQFREDQGPLAHPVRPEEYIEINNFYTATVYEKGAEVIGMLKTLVGDDGYRAALDLYFARHDGEACTIEQFRQCFEDATGRDLAQFARWWSQAGTPALSVEEDWDGETFSLTLAQGTCPTPGQAEKKPLVIPVTVGLLDPDGREIAQDAVLTLSESRQRFGFRPDAPEAGWQSLPLAAPKNEERPQPARAPVPSLLRGFSAPVILDHSVDDTRRAFLLAHDTDPFSRWEAGRAFAINIALGLIAGGQEIPDVWSDGLGGVIADDSLDPAFRALALELPGEDELASQMAAGENDADPDRIHAALRAMHQALATRLSASLRDLCLAMRPREPYGPVAEQAGRRALANRAMAILAHGGAEGLSRAATQYDSADNMTDRLAALTTLVHHDADGAPERLKAFHARWQDMPLVLDKWLTVQATAPGGRTLARVKALTAHSDFDWKNPNRFRALIGGFAMGNPTGFHAIDGSGYRFFTDWLIQLDELNPQTAARMSGAFETWSRYDSKRRALMRSELDRILDHPTLSKNTREMVERLIG